MRLWVKTSLHASICKYFDSRGEIWVLMSSPVSVSAACRRKHDRRLVSAGFTWMQHGQTHQITFYQLFHPQTRPDGRLYLFVLVFFAVFVVWCLLVGAVPLRADTIVSISANFWRFLFVALGQGVRPRRRPAVIASTRQKLLHSTR